MAITASTLRADVYRILDEVLESGEPVEVSRRGRTLLIVPGERPTSRLARLRKRPDLVVGDPDDLVHLDWYSEWQP